MWKLLIIILYFYCPVIHGHPPYYSFCSEHEVPKPLFEEEDISTAYYPGRYRPGEDCYVSRYTEHAGIKITVLDDFDNDDDWINIYEKPSKNDTVGVFAAYTTKPAESPTSEQTSISRRIFAGKEIILGKEVTIYFHSKDGSHHQCSHCGVKLIVEPYKTFVGNLSVLPPVIPPKFWFNTPAITKVSDNVYDVLGREVHMSTVITLLTEDPHINFPVPLTEDKELMELTIRGDTIYNDQEKLTFTGLKKLTIYARKMVGNSCTILLKAPDVCQNIITIPEQKCSFLKKAAIAKNGRNGKNGADAATVNIYVHQIEGETGLLLEASDGNRGEVGGNGKPGKDIATPAADLDASACENQSVDDCKNVKGHQGFAGGNGGDGMKAGHSGKGGSVPNISVTFVDIKTGLLEIEQFRAKGGQNASHGTGGRGGKGGLGGCGTDCYVETRRPLWLERYCGLDELNCDGGRGKNGPYGNVGRDGRSKFRTRSPGDSGNLTIPNFYVVNSLREDFADQPDLLRLIKRKAESMMQRNDNDKAEEIFQFLVSVSEPNSTLHEEASEKLQIMQSGFDYYGNDKAYAPDLGWSYYNDRTNDLLETGKTFETAYNEVKEKIGDINATYSSIDRVTMINSFDSENKEMEEKKRQLNENKDLNFKALRQLELTMKIEMHNIKSLLTRTIRKGKPENIAEWIGAVYGFVSSAAGKDLDGVIEGALSIYQLAEERKNECTIPKIEKASKHLREKATFGYEYEQNEPQELDFSNFDFSMVPEIMQSNIARDRAELFDQLKCVLDLKNVDTVDPLRRAMNDFFRDANYRVSLIDKLMNIDVQLKEVQFNILLLNRTKEAYEAIGDRTTSNIPLDVKTSFTDLLFNMYLQQEYSIMRSLYELSKSYEFSSLWNFHTLSKYRDTLGGMVIHGHLGSLQGITHLENLKKQLDDERHGFLHQIQHYTGPSHEYNLFKEYSKTSFPDMFEDLQANGTFTIRIDLDINDLSSIGCASCFNQRLDAFYVELLGEQQSSSVPSILFVHVTHMGDSYFLTRNHLGEKQVTFKQQNPARNPNVMKTDTAHLIKSKSDPKLEKKFMEEDYQFCHYDVDQEFFTKTPCRSPYSTFVITVPRDPTYTCTLDPNKFISGTNCKNLDYTKFNKVRIYEKVDSWSNYPFQPKNQYSALHGAASCGDEST